MLKAYVAAQTRLEQLKDHMRNLRDDDSGAALVEYALIVGLMAVVITGAFTTLKTPITNAFTTIGNQLNAVK